MLQELIPAVDAEYTEVGGETVVMQEDEDPVITNEQRQELFRTAKKYLGDRANEVVKHIINEMGFTSTTGSSGFRLRQGDGRASGVR